jgi:carboxyl-terminal processing protease
MYYGPPPRPRPLLPLLLVLLLVIPAFLGGAVVERLGWLPGSRAYVPAHLGDTFDPFWEAWGYVERYYVDRDAVNPEHMTHGAIEGMLASLGDVGHTAFLTREEVRQLENSLEGNLEGIGARMTIRKKQPTIMQTMPGSPARQGGLKAGDVLLEVDGKPVTDMSLRRITELVRGPAGTKVTLKILREGEGKVRTFAITRAKIDVPAVMWRMLPWVPAAHVVIVEFGKHADDQLKDALKAARKRGARGLLVDVRGDPGGLKDQAVKVTSEFLKGGVVFIEKNAKGDEDRIKVLPDGVATDLPLVVLTDEGTASSAEIFAGAIKDHKRGKLVGTRTFGTGTVLRRFDLSDGSAVLLAVAEWLTPNGEKIWHKGIDPDVKVTMPQRASILLPDDEKELTAEALAKSDDAQLRRALEVLQEEMRVARKDVAVGKQK